MKNLKKLLLLLCLVVAGVQSVQAREWINKHADVENVPIGGITYEVCHIYWKVGYVDLSLGAQLEDVPGYKERELTNSNSDQVLIALTTNNMFNYKPDDQYYASVVGITGSGEIVIPDSIANGGRKYPVKYIGRHTEQTLVEKDTTYYQQTWLSGSGYYKTTTCKYYGYTLTNVSITASNVSKLTVNGDVDFVGNFSLPSCSSVEFNKDVCFFSNAFFNATDIKFNGATTISQSATLSCYNVEELRFNRITHNGKINFGNHGSLTDIYYLSNLPAYSGSANNYFEGVNLNNVTVHVANKTQSECDAIHSGWATYCSFGDVVPCTTSGVSSFFSNQTFVRIGGNGTVSLTTKHEGETTTYNIPSNGVVTAPLYTFDSGDIMRIVVTTNGEETVEIFRDGIDVTSIFTKNGTTYTYEADDWEANELWFAFMVNVLDEAVWTIKYIDQRQIIYFKDTAVKSICVNKWDTNSDGELSMAEAAAVTYFFGTPPFANNGNITSFDELQYFTSLKSLSLAFKGCTALKSVVIPASVTDVTNAFEDCVSLESVTFVPGSTLTTIGEKAFKGCASLEATFALPEGVTSIGTSAFEGCSTLGKTLGLPDGLTQISASAFKDCTSLSLIYIPKDVTTLRDPFFTGCTNLDYIAVDPENSVFDSRNCCNAIIERNVGAYLQSYLRYACKNSTIPEGVHVIGSSAFAGLPITQIELPSTITLVGNGAFANCQYLESVVCKATTPPTYQGNPFSGISQDCVLTVPSGCTEAYKAAGWKTQDEDGVFKQIVEDKPNPTWNITQGEGATGTQIIITRNDTDEETTLTSAFTTMKINNEGVQKVTLKVPVGHMEQVTKYKVRLLSISDDDDQVAAMRNYLRQKFHLTSAKIDLLLRTLGYMPTDYDTEEEAQVIVDELAAFNATSNIVSSLINQAVSDNVSIKVILNGVDITSQMDTSDPLYATYEVPVADLTDAVWEITIDAGNQTDVNYVFIGNYNFLTAYADYNEGYEYEGSKFYVENVEGYCIGKVVENGSCINEEMGIDFQMQNPNDTFRAFRNGVDVTSQFSKGVNSIWTFTSNDPTMHEPAQWIIVADSDLSRYDVNRDKTISIADVTKLVNKILGKE